MGQDPLGEATQPEDLIDRYPVLGDATGLAGLPQCLFRMKTLIGTAIETGLTVPAELDQRTDDMVTHHEVRDVRTNFGHHPGRLMTEDRRKRVAVVILSQMEIGVTETAGLHCDEDLPLDGLGEIDVLDGELPGMVSNHGCLHGIVPSNALSLGHVVLRDRRHTAWHLDGQTWSTRHHCLGSNLRWPRPCA